MVTTTRPAPVNEASPEPRAQPAPDHGTQLSLRNSAAEITIRSLLVTLWRGRWLALATIVLALLATAAMLKLRVPLYTATMTIAPAEADLGAMSRLATDLEQYAELAALARVPLPVEGVSVIERYAQNYSSVQLAERLQAEQPLLQQIFSEEWDAERGAWQAPTGPMAWFERTVLGFFGYPAWVEPDTVDLADYLQRRVQLGRAPDSSLWGVRYEHRNPAFAVALLERAHAHADAMVREATAAQIARQIEHIEAELQEIDNSTRRHALESLLAEQYQAQALIQGADPFAAEVIVPATASSRPTSTNPLLILTLAAMVGAIGGLFVVFLRDALRRA
jgi:uncharacterized protein involved in exopolysaccharide biosynthesis